MLVHGKNMILQVGGHTVAACRECSLDLSRNMIEIAGDSATAQSFIPGRYGATLSASGLYNISRSPSSGSLPIASTLVNGAKIQFAFQTHETDTGLCDICIGFAFVEKTQFSGLVNNIATYSASFRCTGDITIDRTALQKHSWNPTFSLISDSGTIIDIINTYRSGNSIIHTIAEHYDEVIYSQGLINDALQLLITPNITNFKTPLSAKLYYSEFISNLHIIGSGSEYELIARLTTSSIITFTICDDEKDYDHNSTIRIAFNSQLDHIVEIKLID